ncbi:MAG: hypothetical protein V1761_04375 [bacterium]
MNKTRKWLLATVLTTILGITMVGCSMSDGLNVFLRMASQNIETVASLDDVDAIDMADQDLDDLDIELAFQVTELAADTNLTPAEKIAMIRQLREQMRLTHEAIVAERQALQIAHVALKADVAAFRAADGVLNDVQKAQVADLTLELRTISASLRDSIGLAYQQMRSLRGKYQVQNLDLVLRTHQEVQTVLMARLANLERLNAIFAELSDMIADGE